MPHDLPVEVFCHRCGYDLRGLPEFRCPECGFRYDRQGIRALNSAWFDRCFQELRFATGLQAAFAAAVLVFHVLGGQGSIIFLIVSTLILFVWGWMLMSYLDSWPPSTTIDWLYSFVRNLFVWVVGIFILLLVVVTFRPGGRLLWMVLPGIGLAFGLLALRDYRRGCRLNRGANLAAGAIADLRRWSRANSALMVVSFAAIIAAFLS